MNENMMFNKEITLGSALQYMQSKGLSESFATRTNKAVASYFDYLSGLYHGYIDTPLSKDQFSKQMFDLSVKYKQQSNAYLWLMIYTAIQEKKNGFKYVENYDKYVDEAISKYGINLPNKVKLHIDLCEYFKKTMEQCKHNKFILGMYQNSMQYWIIKYLELDKK